MNSIKDISQELPICNNCPFYFVRVIKENAERWIDLDTGEECHEADYKLVCSHADACKRAYGKKG